MSEISALIASEAPRYRPLSGFEDIAKLSLNANVPTEDSNHGLSWSNATSTATSRHEIAPCVCASVSDRLGDDITRKELRQSRLRPAARLTARLLRAFCVRTYALI